MALVGVGAQATRRTMRAMDITFTKGRGKFDRMTVLRDGASQDIDCPKQRIIPHDMVHYAMESVLLARGFMTRVRDGEAADARMAPEAESEGVERLVEVFQGDASSDGTSAPEDMLDLYQVTRRGRVRPWPWMPPRSKRRARIGELDRQWRAPAVGESITLRL